MTTLLPEIQCINESDKIFAQFIHELGLSMRTTACLSSLRRMRHGHLTDVDHALLWKHWTLEHILNNIEQCRRLVSPALLQPSQNLGADRLISAGSGKYIDSIPADTYPEYITDGREEESNSERLLLEGADVIEERLPSTAKSSGYIDTVLD